MKDKTVGLAALLTAGLASVCCLGPLLLTALGVGGLGLAAGLSQYRPVFLALTAVVLAGGFYRAYNKRAVACADGSCEVRSGSRTMKTALWAVTALAAALATFPSWSARVLARGPVPAAEGAPALTLKVSGMHCAACATAIEESVEKVPGVRAARVDFEGGTAEVHAGPGVEAGAVLEAVEAAGYKAEVLGHGS